MQGKSNRDVEMSCLFFRSLGECTVRAHGMAGAVIQRLDMPQATRFSWRRAVRLLALSSSSLESVVDRWLGLYASLLETTAL